MIKTLKGKKGLIVGIANSNSIAWGCAKAFSEAGADLAITYLNDKAEPYVRPLANQINASIIMPLNVENDAQLNDLFETINQKWGKIDFFLHAIAFAPKEDLQGRLIDVTRDGFLKTIEISCYSFIKLAHLAEPYMKKGGCMLTTTYYGGEKVIPHYGLMGPAKAALESVTKYLAFELGPQNIRVNALSPGPVPTRAASGIAHFNEFLELTQEKAPEHLPISIDAIGSYARFLVSDEAKLVTGSIVYIDAGFNIMGG